MTANRYNLEEKLKYIAQKKKIVISNLSVYGLLVVFGFILVNHFIV